MITTRLNMLILSLIIIVAISSISVNYYLIYEDKKEHVSYELKHIVKLLHGDITQKQSQSQIADILERYSYHSDINIFTAVFDEVYTLYSQKNLPSTFEYKKHLKTYTGFLELQENSDTLFFINRTDSEDFYTIVGVTKASLKSSIVAQTLYTSIWVAVSLALFFGILFWYTKTKIERPFKELFDNSFKEFANGIISSNISCNENQNVIQNVDGLPHAIYERVEGTFLMLQKWSCFKMHFDEFLKTTVAESNKEQLINNLFIAVESDFYVKNMVVLETNHSLNRFDPTYMNTTEAAQDSNHEDLLSNPSLCLAYRTAHRVIIESDKKATCSMCSCKTNDTILCKPMMSNGKQTGVIKFTIDTQELKNSSQFKGNVESKVRFYESYLNAYIDLTSLTISNIILLNAYKNQALTDPLTTLYNRRYITEYMFSLLSISKRKKSPLSVFMMDIDHFKRFNDEYGHKVGDMVLRVVAKTIATHIREGDTVARYGGEEFIAVLPDADTDIALEVAERVRQAVEAIDWHEHQLPNIYPVTISLGIAAYPIHGYSHYHLTNVADKALYKAKREGRNRCLIHEIKERQEEGEDIFA